VDCTTFREETPYEVDRRFGEGRGKPLDVEIARLIVVEIFGEACVWLIMRNTGDLTGGKSTIV
jgi:hypothetical protein